MALREEWQRNGGWLFRWRSYPPLVLAGLVVVVAVLPLRIGAVDRERQEIWEAICLLIGLVGVALRAYVVGHAPPNTSGRNTQTQEADVLNTSGMYSVVRHPLYFANMFMWLGPILVMRSPWATAITLLLFWLYYERIMFAEEEFLRGKFGEAFVSWSAVTPPFVPHWASWRAPETSFCLRYVLKREYSGLFGLVVAFVFADWVDDFAQWRAVQPDTLSLIVLASGALIYFTLRTLKKRSNVLHVEGR